MFNNFWLGVGEIYIGIIIIILNVNKRVNNILIDEKHGMRPILEKSMFTVVAD